MLRRSLTLLGLALCAITASATTFIVPKDEDLVRSAHSIARGVITEKSVYEAADGRIRTRYVMEVQRSLKGNLVTGASITFEEYGGQLPYRGMHIVSTPEYSIGEEALVMFQLRGETLRTHEMVLGKFTQIGDRYVRAVEDDIFGFDPSMNAHVELGRDARGFEKFIEDVVAGRDFSRDYFRRDEQEDGRIRPTVSPDALNYIGDGRRPEFDAGGSVVYRTNGNQATLDGVGAVERAMNAWSGDGESNVNISVAGTTTARFFVNDGINAIEVGMTSGFDLCTSAAAGCAVMFTLGQHVAGGLTFNNIIEADIWIKNGGTGNQNVLDSIVTHEVGHTIGFRHSNEAGRSPNSSTAIMNSVVGAFGANLQGWDTDAVRALYGTGVSTCDAPVITTHPESATILTGGSKLLTVDATGTTPLSYAWFRGPVGTTTTQVGSSRNFTASNLAVGEHSFWVRVTNSCGSDDSDAAIITVEAPPCVAPAIGSGGQPQGTVVFSGQSTTMSVLASGSDLTYQWYRGESGETGSPVFGQTQPTLQTGALTVSTPFWVRISNSCGTIDSQHAVVTVEECTAVQITSQPQPAQITTGGSTTLSVTASGSDPLSYQWFRGASGDLSSPITGGTSASLFTGVLTANSSYWVRVSNGCTPGGVNSITATVTVVASCTAPSITATSPLAVTINAGASTNLSATASGTSLAYQWFRGSSGDTSSPVTGATGATFATGALAANSSFWVRVSNSCGTSNSGTFVITVTPLCNLTIITQPLTQKVSSGATVVLTSAVTASGPVTFQWFNGNSGDTSKPVAGATTSTLTLSQLRQSGSYWMRASSSCGTRDSNTATITVETSKRKRPVRRG